VGIAGAGDGMLTLCELEMALCESEAKEWKCYDVGERSGA
jgi:hypothetical protein